MSIAAPRTPLISSDEYLTGEETSLCKHEYLNGMVYAMAGGTRRHSALAVNIVFRLRARLSGKRCQPYNSDLLLRVRNGDDQRFYYPDVTIHCGTMSDDARFMDDPTVIFEVLSESTARIDTGEKRMAYLTISTLEAYVIVDSNERAVTVWRRKDGSWQPEVLSEPEATLTFTSADCSLTIGEIYEGTGL